MSLNEASTKITDGGRIVIPSLYRQKLGLDIGDEVILLLENGEIRILSRQAASDRARSLVARYAKGRNLADELIKERRLDAANDSLRLTKNQIRLPIRSSAPLKHD